MHAHTPRPNFCKPHRPSVAFHPICILPLRFPQVPVNLNKAVEDNRTWFPPPNSDGAVLADWAEKCSWDLYCAGCEQCETFHKPT